MTHNDVAACLNIKPESVRSTMRRHGIGEQRGYPRDQVLALRDTREQKKPLTADAIEAWVFKCNATEMWDIVRALDNGKTVDSWRLVQDYRVDLIRALPDHPAVLWVSGSTGATPEPGIWMTGFTTGEIIDNGQGDEYWLNEAERRKPRPYAVLSGMRPRDPVAPLVPRALVAANPLTNGMEVLRVPRRGNPSYLTHVEKAAVWEMIGGGYGE